MEASPTGTLGFSRPSLNGGQSSNPPFGSRPFTDEERLEINRKLKQCLGSEYMANRSGPGGGKLTYLEGYRAISLAHEIFGFDGWSHSILETSVDYVDIKEGGSVSVGISVIIRVTLKDGTSHEDFGYGSIENARSKSAAFEKVKKEAVTDGIKRALRAFGNALGNCLYDKDGLKKILKIPAIKPLPLVRDDLYRGEEFFKPNTKPSSASHLPQIPSPHIHMPPPPPPNVNTEGNEFDELDEMIIPGDLENIDPRLLMEPEKPLLNKGKGSNDGPGPSPPTISPRRSMTFSASSKISQISSDFPIPNPSSVGQNNGRNQRPPSNQPQATSINHPIGSNTFVHQQLGNRSLNNTTPMPGPPPNGVVHNNVNQQHDTTFKTPSSVTPTTTNTHPRGGEQQCTSATTAPVPTESRLQSQPLAALQSVHTVQGDAAQRRPNGAPMSRGREDNRRILLPAGFEGGSVERSPSVNREPQPPQMQGQGSMPSFRPASETFRQQTNFTAPQPTPQANGMKRSYTSASVSNPPSKYPNQAPFRSPLQPAAKQQNPNASTTTAQGTFQETPLSMHDNNTGNSTTPQRSVKQPVHQQHANGFNGNQHVRPPPRPSFGALNNGSPSKRPRTEI